MLSAIQHLDKVRWHDKQIRVATSKHSNVQMPKEGSIFVFCICKLLNLNCFFVSIGFF